MGRTYFQKKSRHQCDDRDIVCGRETAGLPERVRQFSDGREYVFCGKECAERFFQNRQQYSGAPLIEVRGIQKYYVVGKVRTEVLRGFDMNVWEGEFVAVMGASGSGKSTLLNILGLLDRPTGGEVRFRGESLSQLDDEERAKMRSAVFGFVFQQYHLIPWLNAFENVVLPLVFSGKKMDHKSVEKMFAQFGLQERMTHRPAELSGGEQQRVALLRALVNDPLVLLGDEPTGNLDSATGRKMLEVFLDLNQRLNKTLIIVTHDPEISRLADRVVVIRDGKRA